MEIQIRKKVVHEVTTATGLAMMDDVKDDYARNVLDRVWVNTVGRDVLWDQATHQVRQQVLEEFSDLTDH